MEKNPFLAVSFLYTNKDSSWLSNFCTAEDCLLPADSNGRDTPFSSHASPSLPNGTQAIVASYKFHCYGNITAWRTYVQANNPTPHVIHFQVWRPSPGTEIDGCYALVGENVLSDAVATADGLISTTPGPDDIIRVSPGDVIGYYSQSGSEEDMVGATTTEVLLDTSYADEVVWYHTNSPEDPLISSGFRTCPFPAGPNKALGSFINAAPVISIDMGKLDCVTQYGLMLHNSLSASLNFLIN